MTKFIMQVSLFPLTMIRAKTNLLITGLPGVGKTTLIRRLAEKLGLEKVAGFYTEEIRERGGRKGFALTGFDGSRGRLSHVDIDSPVRVGKYGVDLAGFENFLDKIDLADPEAQYIIIDEIGKMECYSRKFTELVTSILDSEKLLIATIARQGGGFMARVKNRSDISIIEITTGNREHILNDILKAVYSQVT